MSNVNITNTNNTVQPTIILNTVSVVTSETQVDVTNPVTNVVEVIHIGPQGTQGIQGIQGETGLTITDLFVYRGNNTWSTTGSLQISSSLIISQSVTGLSGFTGSLLGTASWARNAVTASYILSSNVSGPNGFDSVNYASSAGSADAVTDPLTQDLQIRGLLSTRIALTDLQGLLAGLYANTGNVVEGAVGTSVDRGNLCYLDFNTTSWKLVNQSSNTSTNLLAVCVEATTGYFLLDGKITLDNTFIGGTLRRGYPVYLSGSGLFTTNVATLTTGYVRIVGHLLDTNGSGNWLLNFRPDHTWIEL